MYYQPEDNTEISSIIENVNITIAYDPAYSPYNYSQIFNLNIGCY